MNTSPEYKYFERLYSDTGRTIICTNEQLKLIYATPVVYDLFSLDSVTFTDLDVVFPNMCLNQIKDAFLKNKCIVFNYMCLYDNKAKSCLVTPLYLNREIYATINITNVQSDTLGSMQKYELKHAVNVVSEVIRESLNDTNRYFINNKTNFDIENGYDHIMQNILKITRSFNNLKMISRDSADIARGQRIDLHAYIERITSLISDRILPKQIDFFLDFCNELLVIDSNYQLFDILFCNIISNSIKSTPSKLTEVSIKTVRKDDQAVLIFTDSGKCFRNLGEMFRRAYNPKVSAHQAKTGLYVIKKIVAEHGGSMFTDKSSAGGLVLVITIPLAKHFDGILCSPETFPMDYEISKSLHIGLAEHISEWYNKINQF